MDRKTLRQRGSNLFNNRFGHDIFAAPNGNFFVTVGKQDSDVVVVLAKDFANSDFIDYQYFATFALQLGPSVFQRASGLIAGFSSKSNDNSW